MIPKKSGAEAQRHAGREVDLDELDERLIRELRTDGRASFQDLATRLGISRDLASQRYRTLVERDGLRVVAALDPSYAGHHVLVHAMVEVEGPVAPVAHRIAELPDTVLVSLTSGMHPLVFESRHGSEEQLQDMLERVREITGVRRVRVTTYVGILKGFFVATKRAEVTLDALDTALISQLQRDGRKSFKALADTVHLSPSSVRARVKRLVDAGVIRISTITSGKLSRTRIAVGLGITARGGGSSAIGDALFACENVDFAVRAHGNFDYIGTLFGGTSAQMLAALEELRALPEVGMIETWTHYDIIKESYERASGGTIEQPE